ncbi:MAG: zinc-dependent metalloprotease, partial [Casimicrobiaceae bacterium]
AASAAAQAAQAAKPFAEVTREATEQKGLFNLWRKDDKVWIELAPDQLDHAYFFKSALNQGIGERGIFGGAMTDPIGVAQVIVFHRLGKSVQLIAKNVTYTATPGTPEAFAVAAAFSDSLLAAAPIASQPRPGTESILVDANALLFTDIPQASRVLERTYRQSYAFDARNSSFGKLWTSPDNVALEVSAHYALAHIALPPPPPAKSTLPPPPSTLPDIRSLFLGYYYTFATLPPEPLRPRLADDRIGYFTTDRFDFTSDLPRLPIEHFIDRWRLEKKDPSAPLSEPKQPIVYWLDRDIPVKYRQPIREGILEWNKAFEKIGIKDAIRVDVQPDDADFDTSDIRHASVRWQTVAQSAYGAIGPSVVDPRTGEILDADIGIDANNIRTVRSLRREYIPPPSFAYQALAGPQGSAAMADEPGSVPGLAVGRGAYACTYGNAATEEAAFGLSLLELRGEITPDSRDVDRFVDAYLKAVVMHEVGHTLGLRHNFRASTIYAEAELSDPAFTQVHGISGSVMEYNPWNIAAGGERQGDYDMTTLGPYDYWAIEYGYREVPAADEPATLAAIAGRSNEHDLAFASDEDVFVFGVDPAVNVLDLGRDPLAYAKKRLELVHEIWRRTEALELAPGESYSVLMRNFTRGLNQAAQGALYAVKYVGGLTTLRDRAGSGRAPLTPIDPVRQR